MAQAVCICKVIVESVMSTSKVLDGPSSTAVCFVKKKPHFSVFADEILIPLSLTRHEIPGDAKPRVGPPVLLGRHAHAGAVRAASAVLLHRHQTEKKKKKQGKEKEKYKTKNEGKKK